MTIGSENVWNGSGTAQDRFSGGVSAYRQTRREAALAAEHGHGEVVGWGDGSPLPTRSPGTSGSTSGPMSQALEPTSALERAARLPSLELPALTEPMFGTTGGSTTTGSASATAGSTTAGSTTGGNESNSMADHPLLRGLLMELPARGAMPASDWLDRWFEAARSILELLYVQEARKKR
jgi:hypothetical protein